VTLRHLDVATLRAAWWAHRALRSARRQLRRTGYEDLSLPALPDLPVAAGRGVHAVMRRQSHTCLERAMVLQRWRAAHGDPQDVVIGVCPPSAGFVAHAWLADEDTGVETTSYIELVRLHP
jgi:hypothetical protein